MNNNNKLQDFVATTVARGRITFGDVRRLARDMLPGGITACDEIELLIGLDRVVSRADRAWTGWLVGAILAFAARCDQATEAGAGPTERERLKALLAAGRSSRAARRVAAEINRPAERSAEPVRPAPQPIALPVERANAAPVRRVDIPPLAVLPVQVWSMNRLPMAA